MGDLQWDLPKVVISPKKANWKIFRFWMGKSSTTLNHVADISESTGA